MSGSIFEELNKKKSEHKIWHKAKKETVELKLPLKYHEFGCFVVGKISGSEKIIEPREFFFLENYFFYKKNGKITAYIDINFAVVTFQKNEDSESEFKFKMRIVKNLKYCDLFIKSENDLRSIRKKLAPFAIFTDFYENYKIEKTIGKGAFASVKL